MKSLDSKSQKMIFRRRSRVREALPAILITAVILLGSVGAYYLLRDETKPPPEAQGPVRQLPDSHARPTLPSQPAQTQPGDQARMIIEKLRQQEGTLDLSAVYAEADRFRAAERPVDAHLLHFFAARAGHAPSARLLAEMYDPIYFSSSSSVMDEPNPAQAVKWYRKAIEGGDELAKTRLEGLKVWVEKVAQQGDPEAQRLLMLWQ